MIAVIFEVWPAAGQQQAYLDMAAGLKAELQCIDGFISIERFESLAEPGKLLSLSFWRDEAAVAADIERRVAVQLARREVHGVGGHARDSRRSLSSGVRDQTGTRTVGRT